MATRKIIKVKPKTFLRRTKRAPGSTSKKITTKKSLVLKESQNLFKQKTTWIGLFLVIVSLFWGSKAQNQIVASGLMPNWQMWGFYFFAALLFVAGVSLVARENEKSETDTFSTKAEGLILCLILGLAAFLRIYHLDSMPSGIFIDQGMEGWAALRILHEHFCPGWDPEAFHNPSLLLYQLAGWFVFFKPTQFNFYLFFALLSLATLPLFYWTVRQIAGQKTALLALFILSVMRWYLNFSRDGFPSIEVPFYIFGTLAFLLYGVRSGKKWPFYVSAVFFAAGFYAYQSFQIVPLLVFVFAIYEMISNWKGVAANWKSILGFLILFLLLAFPFFQYKFPYFQNVFETGGLSPREASVSILKSVKDSHSLKPVIDNIELTASMFNWRGDPNARHDLQNYRMLDDVTGELFVFGFIGCLVFFWKKPAFYGLVGLLVLSVPAILSVEAPHANRMLATTPFIALLAAWPIATFWEKWEMVFKLKNQDIFFILLAVPLYFMGYQNFDVYFHKQANDIASWRESAIDETTIAKRVAEYGDTYDYYISPRYFDYFTIKFLAYFHLNLINNMTLPDGIISRDDSGISRGIYFALEKSRIGVFSMIKTLYPTGVEESLIDPEGNKELFLYHISADDLAKVRGLKAVFDRPVGRVKEKQILNFATGLPEGPYRATLTGNFYVAQQGNYHWKLDTNIGAAFWVKEKLVSSLGGCYLEAGFHPVKLQLDVPAGKTPVFTMMQTFEREKPVILRGSDFNSLSSLKGLKGNYYHGGNFTGTPFLVQWDPILNYVNGNDFSVGQPFSVHWSGTFRADQSGNYQIFALSSGYAGLKVDGKNWFTLRESKNGNGFLRVGIHSIDVYYWNNGEMFPYFSLFWTKPDGAESVIPNSVFGLVP